MMKQHFASNRLLAKKLEDQKATWPVERELNEQELAIVTGGGGSCGCDEDWDDCFRRRHFHRHAHHHRHHHDD